MQAYTFRDDIGQIDRLRRKILSALRGRYAASFPQICGSVAEKEADVRAALDELVGDGRVERLRPVDCADDRHDGYSLRSVSNMTARRFDV